MNFLQRFKAPTPPFFKRLRKAALALAALGSSFQAVPHANEQLLAVGIQFIVIGTVAALVAQFAVDTTSNTDADETTKP